jgi:TolA-binding protein
MANATEKSEPTKFSDKLVVFLQKYRIALLVLIGVVIVGVVVSGVTIAVVESTKSKNIATAEDMAERYDAIRIDADEAKRANEVTALIGELESFAKAHSGFASARAYSVLAGIRADKKEWTEAEAAWLSAAEALPKSYLAPVAIYDAATAAEELGDGTRALELYARCAEQYGTTFSQTPRAYLAIGRLNEERKDFEAATTAYKKIVETWPNDSWAKLAHSRLLAISSQGSK